MGKPDNQEAYLPRDTSLAF